MRLGTFRRTNFGIMLACSVLATTRVALPQTADFAQADQQAAAEFSRLIERAQTNDPEEGIAAIEAALKLEPELKTWPFKGSRQQLKGSLLISLGLNYSLRRLGQRADNLEKAIAAYEAVLTIRTREESPLDWAQTQTNLGDAYVGRILGERADNMEKAIAHFEAAQATCRFCGWVNTKNNFGAYTGIPQKSGKCNPCVRYGWRMSEPPPSQRPLLRHGCLSPTK
jgi:hypothetical protein